MNYGRYEIIREIGRGSMGMVYLARDPQIGRDIALKVLRPDRVESEDFVRRFLREARAIGRMSHPNVVTVHDVGEDHGTVYIAMELLEGEPLNVYAAKRTLRLEDIAGIGAQIARCLDYAHGRGIVHRDVKPQNIIVSPDGTVKLTDFGIAHIEDPEAGSQTQAGEILG
ncbi:MAG TPA: serine/threonine-protein kinase, partial [Deltaproteobacteria bacterium]|nr:serine/threonine-protein kinase [Deltaproteobacteria bacterium]